MNPHLAWYTARAAGIVAWLLLAATVLGGLVFSTRLLRGRPTPRWQLDLHRFLATLSVVFTLIHVGALVADDYLRFTVGDILVPLASDWRPGAVALGVVGLWLLVAIQTTSLLMARMPRRAWHGIHLTSYGLFWTATLHGLLAGTDAHRPLSIATANVVVALVVFTSLTRSLQPRRIQRRHLAGRFHDGLGTSGRGSG
jgi:predicted ferric reductase